MLPGPTGFNLSHEQGFYDNGNNVGYFNTGVLQNTENSSDYTMFGPYYDDTIMGQAFNNVMNTGQWGPNNYHNPDPTIGDYQHHDCQDFGGALRDEYKNLGGQTCSVPFNGGSCPTAYPHTPMRP
jgi:hypothetical protein